jgi:hypothetical protein
MAIINNEILELTIEEKAALAIATQTIITLVKTDIVNS